MYTELKDRSRVVLGTAQFGMQYGFYNTAGRPTPDNVISIVEHATRAGVCFVDTADAYGESQQVLARCDLTALRVMSKFILSDHENVRISLEHTLSQLMLNSLHAYSFHRFHQFASFRGWDEINDLKRRGLVEKLGVSVYSNAELEAAAEHPQIDLIQMPFNVFDHFGRRRKGIEAAKRNGKTLHVRSVFFQGLIFQQPESLTGKLASFSEPLRQLNQIATSNGTGIGQLCLNYALGFPEFDGVVLGIDSLAQLDANLRAVSNFQTVPAKQRQRIESLTIADETLLNPGTWGTA